MFEHALAAIEDRSLDATIEFVFMHRERGEGEGSDGFMDLAASRGIPVATLSSQRFRREHDGDFAGHREEFDVQALALMEGFQPDLCVLAGYLLILSPHLTAHFRLLNLHPALPGGPIGLWQKVIWELIDQRASESGLMTFAVTDDLDEGPPASVARFPLRGAAYDRLWEAAGGDTADAIKARDGEEHPLFQAIRADGVKREPILLTETLRAVARGEITVGSSYGPMDLSDAVEARLSR